MTSHAGYVSDYIRICGKRGRVTKCKTSLIPLLCPIVASERMGVSMMAGYKSQTQDKNIAWYLPRPKPDRYKGGMPLYAEDWIIDLAKDILGNDSPSILQVFCGMNKHGFRVDLNPDVSPDLIADAHELSKHINRKFDLIIADPPYSNQEATDLYGTPKLKYKLWTSECDKLLKDGGLLVIYHKFVVPNPNPDKYFVEKRVFIGNRTWHLPRVAIYFRKKDTPITQMETEATTSPDGDLAREHNTRIGGSADASPKPDGFANSQDVKPLEMNP